MRRRQQTNLGVLKTNPHHPIALNIRFCLDTASVVVGSRLLLRDTGRGGHLYLPATLYQVFGPRWDLHRIENR